MKKLHYLIIVNTDTPAGEEFSKDQLIEYHTTPEHLGGLGLNRPRIDDLISLEGELINIIPEGQLSEVDQWGIAQGVDPLNGQAKYVALVGGRTKDSKKSWDTRTREQKESLATYVKYHALRHPELQVLGLDQVPALTGSDMPGFNVPKWLANIGLEEQHIFKQEEE